jgi:integrase
MKNKTALKVFENAEAAEMRTEAEEIFNLLDVRENTRRDYKARIGLFLKFLKENGLNRDTFLRFKRYLTERNDIKPATKNKYLASARVFLKELNRIGKLPADITQNIKSFTENKKHKKDGLSDREITTLMAHVKALPISPQTARIKALLSLFIFQGLRQIEVVRLDVSDIDFIRTTASIHGKGQDDKELIYLQPETINALKEYLTLNHIKDGALFVSQSNSNKNNRLSIRGLQKIVNDILCELDIKKNIHGFRHYFTTKLIKVYKGDLLEVSRYTRHKSLEMLQVYNDNIKAQADLPRFYGAFADVSFN